MRLRCRPVGGRLLEERSSAVAFLAAALLLLGIPGAVALLGCDKKPEPDYLVFEPREGGVAALGAKPVPAPPTWDDDFARDRDEPDLWQVESGEWSLNAFRDPGKSANPFKYCGRSKAGGAAEAVTGEAGWRNYRFEVSARYLEGASAGAALGISICGNEDGAGYYLRITRGNGTARLLRVVGSGETLLADAACSLRPGVWYRLALEAAGGNRGGGGRVSAFVDGREVASAPYTGTARGRAGLYLEGDITTEFDDAAVRPARHFEADFDGDHPAAQWERVSGRWYLDEVAPPGRGRSLAAEAGAQCVVFAGDASWKGYELSADVYVRPPKAGPAGEVALVFLARDPGTCYALRCGAAGTVTLTKSVDGVETHLARAPGGLQPGVWRRLSARVSEGFITCSIDGRPVVEAVDFEFPAGRVGLVADAAAGAAFDNVTVRFPRGWARGRRMNPVFTAQDTMKAWSRESSAWRVGDGGVRWHTGELRGDCAVALSGIEAASPAEVYLAARTEDPAAGYGMTLSPHSLPADGGDGSVSLARRGATVATARVPVPAKPYSIELARRGQWVAAYLDGRGVLRFRDEDPLTGRRLGFRADAKEAGVEGGHFLDYTFHSAPVDWEPASGEWGVTQRWACDPRWSFFGGRSREVAAIWSKRAFEGDLTVEIYCALGTHVQDYAPKRTIYLKGVREYDHPSDLNVTICGDGADVESGYAFVFNGWERTRTAIVRRGEMVAETKEYLFGKKNAYNSRYNRHWFHVVIEKRGGELRYTVDGRPLLAYEDAEPIDAGRIALWTRNNRMLVGRVRVYHEAEARREGNHR